MLNTLDHEEALGVLYGVLHAHEFVKQHVPGTWWMSSSRMQHLCLNHVFCLDPQQPVKFKAHLEFGEVRKSTPEEMEKLQQLIDAQNALDALEEERDAARAAEAAAKAAE